MDDRIEQEITVQASLDRVWELVTRPGWWVPGDDAVPPDRTPGSLTVRASQKWGRYVVELVRLEPKTYAAFRWASAFPGEDLKPGRATLVEFFVKPAGEEVSVTVVESGFGGLELPADRREQEWKSNTGGWQEELASLRTQATA
jgi:uncharacterized protein YndB with AHSA1/START domain